jgi:iron complex transport system substrate-binding protein
LQPGLALTSAAKARRVVEMEALYLLGFGPRLPQAVLELAKKIRQPQVAINTTTRTAQSVMP